MPRLLFGPLVVQFVRWLSHPRIRSSADAAAMINALDTALGTAEPAVRTVAARALTEFLHYAVRSAEAAPADARTVRDRPTQIIERILELARHTSATKRLGAADAINAAYRFLREEPPLLQRFALSLATALLAALRMADADDPAVGTVPALEAALTRFHRIFTNPRTAPLFALPTSAAVAAAAAAPGADAESSEQVVDLPSLARLLWAYSIKPESAARRAAQKMLAVIAPVVSGSAHAWFAASRDRLLAAWEAHSLRQTGGSWPGAGAGEDALVAAQTWLKSLSGALHGRCFALQAFGAPAERLFGSPSLAANLVLFEREWLVRRPGDLTGVTQRLLRPHCDVVLGLLQAFALSTRATDGAPPQSLMSPAVLRAAALVTLQPWELGLDVGSADLVTQVCSSLFPCRYLSSHLCRSCPASLANCAASWHACPKAERDRSSRPCVMQAAATAASLPLCRASTMVWTHSKPPILPAVTARLFVPSCSLRAPSAPTQPAWPRRWPPARWLSAIRLALRMHCRRRRKQWIWRATACGWRCVVAGALLSCDRCWRAVPERRSWACTAASCKSGWQRRVQPRPRHCASWRMARCRHRLCLRRWCSACWVPQRQPAQANLRPHPTFAETCVVLFVLAFHVLACSLTLSIHSCYESCPILHR
jgi:hypothetical protein